MWIANPTARRLGLGNEFFDRRPTHVTPPGATFLKNSEHLYGLWFFAIKTFMEWRLKEQDLQIGEPDENGLRTFQGRAALGALKTTSYWLTAILSTLIEAYMKDLLTFVALVDPRIIEVAPKSPVPPGTAQATETKRDIAPAARRWARAWLRSRKRPREWIAGFEQLGVTGFTPNLSHRLYELLGVRHLVVHSAGIVDQEYLRHHPTSPWPLGSEASIDEGMLHGFVQTTFEFFAPIEAHFVNRYVRTRP